MKPGEVDIWYEDLRFKRLVVGQLEPLKIARQGENID